jgi:hypothetical protein
LNTIQIPASFEFIGRYCFKNCKSLYELIHVFGSGNKFKLQRIEGFILSDTNLKLIQITSSVKFIGQFCFFSCPSLREVIFEGNVEIIEEEAFRKCPLTCVKIPHGVKVNCEFPIGCRSQ